MRQIWITKTGRPETLASRKRPILNRRRAKSEQWRRAASISPTSWDAWASIRIARPCRWWSDTKLAVASMRLEPAPDPGWVGRDVFAVTHFGGYSEVVCVPENQGFARPAGMSALEGAALPVNYLTAWQLVVVIGGLKPGETMLVDSAGGGVGIAATQIAKHIGARVIGTASGSKHDRLKDFGADYLIDYRREDFEAPTREITEGRGVELVLDAWAKSFGESSACSRPPDVSGCSASSPPRTPNSVMFSTSSKLWPARPGSCLLRWLCSTRIRGSSGSILAACGARSTGCAAGSTNCSSFGAGASSNRKSDRVFSFDKAPLAHHYIQDRKNVGKVLLKP